MDVSRASYVVINAVRKIKMREMGAATSSQSFGIFPVL